KCGWTVGQVVLLSDAWSWTASVRRSAWPQNTRTVSGIQFRVGLFQPVGVYDIALLVVFFKQLRVLIAELPFGKRTVLLIRCNDHAPLISQCFGVFHIGADSGLIMLAEFFGLGFGF